MNGVMTRLAPLEGVNIVISLGLPYEETVIIHVHQMTHTMCARVSDMTVVTSVLRTVESDGNRL